jgi:hypothetical protein
MKQTVLLFNIPDKGLRNRLRNLFTPLRIDTKYVERSRYNYTLGQLAGLCPGKKVPTAYTGSELEGAMVIFANLPEQTLDAILDILRQMPDLKLPYKAILTETNSGWTVPECFAEIKREHTLLHQGQ